MHKIVVQTIGSKNFNTSLEELKDFLNFKLNIDFDKLENQNLEDVDVLLIHEDFLNNNINNDNLLKKINKVKILVSNSRLVTPNYFHDFLHLPTSVKELNEAIENSIAKKNFNINSAIKVKGYILDKNEKKLKKEKSFILLTEKEIHLLELFLENKTSIHKDDILKKVWGYADDADTHTVETHIYRLRKKIKENFNDNTFIMNNKEGYFI